MFWILLWFGLLFTIIVGFITVIKWIAKLVTVDSASPVVEAGISPAARPSGASGAALAREKLRLKLEALYFDKKISLEAMTRMLKEGIDPDAQGIYPFPTVGGAPVGQSLHQPPASSAPSDFFPSPASSPIRRVDAAPKSTATGPVKTSSQTTSGFFSSTAVKTLLLTGSALLIFSAYLFVRSYWDFIPNALKFFSLAVTTVSIYGVGYFLRMKKTLPVTSKTLVTLGLLLLPFNVAAMNILLFDGALSANATYALGSLVLLGGALVTSFIYPSSPMGLLLGMSVYGAIFFGGLAFHWELQTVLMAVAIGAAVLVLLVSACKFDGGLQAGIFYISMAAAAANLFFLFSYGFFLAEPVRLSTAVNLGMLGLLFVFLSRFLHPIFATLAGLCLMGTLGVLLKYWGWPLYQYGYVFIPAGLISILRAWTFERSGRAELARPYFWFGQMAVMVSILLVGPLFNLPHGTALYKFLPLIVAASLTYIVAGMLYKNSVYTYAVSILMILLTGFLVLDFQLAFPNALLWFAVLSIGLVVMGSLGDAFGINKIGFPLQVMGLLVVSLALSLLFGEWGHQLLLSGTLLQPLPADQLKAGLWTGALGAFAYGFVALLKRQTVFLYPLFICLTWVYVCWLQVLGIPVDLLNASFVVPVLMGMGYLVRMFSGHSISRSFVLWGEMMALLIAVVSVTSLSEQAVPAVLICTLSFLPALWYGDRDLSVGLLMGTYLTHFLLFQQWHGFVNSQDFAMYALQLVAVNIGVVFFRTLVGFARPGNSVTPYRVMALAFSALSIGLSLYDLTIAWQVFLAYGLLALAVSFVHYSGRYKWVGFFLLFCAAELFFASRNIAYVEVYTVPVALLLFLEGNRRRDKSLRDFLFGVGQVVLYLPSSVQAMHETWEWHGIFLGVSSLIVMLWGISKRNRCLTFGSALVLIGNGFVQSRQFFLTVPRWIYLGLGGLTLLTLGGIFEFKRNSLLNMKNRLVSSFEKWD